MSCLRIMISLLLLVVRLINTQYVEESRPGVCPTFRSDVICSQALIKSDCTGKDSECANPKQKCCPAVCGSFKCQIPITGNRPGCPAINPDLRCIVFRQECNSDRDCEKGNQCCFQPSCGTTCQKVTYPPPGSVCPPYGKDVECKRFDAKCNTNDDCKDGNVCCTVECGKACRNPYKPPVDVCHLPKDPGPCEALFHRYYYDDDSKACFKFTYGGCQGNTNNFQTIEECEERCQKPEPQCKPFICTLDCKFGFATDDNGCKLCKCNKKPDCPAICQIFCPFGNVLDDNGCPKCKCKTEHICPRLLCARECELGFELDAEGCQTCVCKQQMCPADRIDSTCHDYNRECKDDSSCQYGRKCCRQGCSYICVDPVK